MSKLNNLTWKYFTEQKLLEVLIVLGILFIPYLASFFGKKIPFEPLQTLLSYETFFGMWFDGLLTIFLVIFLIAFVLFVLGVILVFLWKNWEKAERRAKKKLRKKKATRKRGSANK